MTDTSNTADILDIRDLIERVEELRDQRTHKYVAGWNMPGYMPDSDPAEFEDADEAREHIRNEIEAHADRMEEEADSLPDSEKPDRLAEVLSLREDAAAIYKPNTEGSAAEVSVTLAGVTYWITYEGVTGLDDEETGELAALESFLDELKGQGGDHKWEGYWYPVTLVRDGHFEDYARELAEDLHGDAISSASWPFDCIDWEKAAETLRMDYSTASYDGAVYWYR